MPVGATINALHQAAAQPAAVPLLTTLLKPVQATVQTVPVRTIRLPETYLLISSSILIKSFVLNTASCNSPVVVNQRHLIPRKELSFYVLNMHNSLLTTIIVGAFGRCLFNVTTSPGFKNSFYIIFYRPFVCRTFCPSQC